MEPLRPLILTLLFCGLCTPAWAQSNSQPIQNERQSPIDCLFALETLDTSFRTHLNRNCFEVPQKLCELRGVTQVCLAETVQSVHQFIDENRARMPAQIQDKVFRERNYRRKLAQIDTYLNTHANCKNPAGMDHASCNLQSQVAPTLTLFHLARIADFQLKR